MRSFSRLLVVRLAPGLKLPTLLAITLLAGCASTRTVEPGCAPDSRAGDHLVALTQGQSTTHLLLHGRSGPTAAWVALNPVGARLFDGEFAEGTVRVTAAPLYRGPDPATVLWAFALWHSRERAEICWPTARQKVSRSADGVFTLEGRRTPAARWTPKSPQVLELPTAGLQLEFREME